MDLKRNGSQASARGPAEYFTGTVRIDQLFKAGDVVWCPAGEQHWHGAMPGTAMTRIAIQEELNGKVVDWIKRVADEQYNATPQE